MTFQEMLHEQRADDHRFYHHNRINQSLHVFSSILFIVMYGLLATQHWVAAAIIGWPVAFCFRQAGHFFFEPQGFDEVNKVSHEYKESVKVGYNLHRKRVLLSVWVSLPFVLLLVPSFFGIFTPHTDFSSYLEHLSKIWVALGVGGLLFRTFMLFFIKDVKTGVVWFSKILTDPFHDIYLYWRAPLQALRGEMYEAGHEPRQHEMAA